MDQSYEEMPGAMSFSEMKEIHREMMDGIEPGDSDGLELYQELLEAAVRYAGIRQGWFLMSREQRMEQDASRTAVHDSLIIKFNMLDRYQRMVGKSGAWREKLGDEHEGYNRKRIGDMGCYIAFVQGLVSR